MAPQATDQTLPPSLITHGLVVVSVVFPLIALASILLRYKARRATKQKIGADDLWIVIAWMSTFAMSVIIWVFSSIIGIDTVKSVTTSVTPSLLCLWLLSCVVQLPLSAVKISILLFYKRIFFMRGFRVIVWITIAIISCWGILFLLLLIFVRDPVKASWDANAGSDRFNSAKLGYAQVGTSIALDMVVLCLPIPQISRLHLDMKRKIAIVLIFWLASFCVVAAIVRLILLRKTLNTVETSAGHSAINVEANNIIFILLEPNCSIIAACLPCYGPLAGGWSQLPLVRSVQSFFSLRSRGNTDDSNHARHAEDGSGSLSDPAKESQVEFKNVAEK